MKSKIATYIRNNTTWREDFKSLNIHIDEDDHFIIFNYEAGCDFSNELVQEARGIILDKETLEVACWPFRKFANSHEPYADDIDWATARVQEKIDGCVDENTLIFTNYGPLHIKDIVNSKRRYKVLTYNHETGKNEFNYIDGISVQDNDGKQWYEIETDYGILRLTGNHKIFCINEGKYKRVDKLDGTEELQLLEPSDYQLQNKLNQYSVIYELIDSDIVEQYLNGVPIYELCNIYNCNDNVIRKLLVGYYGIRLRNISDSKKTVYTQCKTIDTILKKYSVENVSQANIIKAKKEQTFLDHYGVTNIRKLPAFYDYINEVCLSKFGKRRITNSDKLRETRSKHIKENPHYYDDASRRLSQSSKKTWNNLSEEAKAIKVNKLREGYHKSQTLKSSRSKIEQRVYMIVQQHTVKHQHTFWINKPKKYSYDILFDGNKIIEVNGDYWHANPNQFKPTDILNIKGIGQVTAKEIWEKDLNKKRQAENLGYHVIYLWESEINVLNDTQIWNLIQERFNRS